MDRKVFWATKSPLPEYHAITFSHPAFDAPIRLVANKYAEVTLGGNVHTPAGMNIVPPEQKSEGQPRLTLVFPRQAVGREFKRQLRLIAAAGSLAPIQVNYDVYLGDTDAPEVTWLLYVAEQGGIQFGTDSVQVLATVDNPLRRSAAIIYDPGFFTGLELIQ